jgi:hypothetical protein
MSNESFEFSTKSIIVPVDIDGEAYELREASGEAAVRYQNSQFEHTQLGPEGKPISLRGMANSEPLLVSLCLFKDEKPVPLKTITSWPAKLQRKLAAKIKEISELDVVADMKTLIKQRDDLNKQIEQLEKEGDPAKNELEDTTIG